LSFFTDLSVIAAKLVAMMIRKRIETPSIRFLKTMRGVNKGHKENEHGYSDIEDEERALAKYCKY